MRLASFAIIPLSLLTLSACAVVDTKKNDVAAESGDTIEFPTYASAQSSEHVEEPVDLTKDHVAIGWKVDLTRTDGEDLNSYFDVALVVTAEGRTQTVALGNYMGCSFEEIPEDGPLLVLRCWWAGSGDEFQVRMEGTNTIVVDYREVGEGMEANPEFKPFKRVTIPDGLPIVPVPGEGVVRG